MMKKNNLLILAVAALGFAACANDETTAVNEKLAESNAISFRANVTGNMRAAASDDGTGTYGLKTIGFKAFATKAGKTYAEGAYFPEEQFSWNAGSSTYNSVNKYYWPASGNLDFYAYAYPTSLAAQITAHTANTLKFSVTPADAVANQVDLLVAATKDKAKADCTGGVTINFRHTGSQVQFMVKNTSSTLKFDIQDLKVLFISKSGDFAFTAANTDTKNSAQLAFNQWSNWGTANVSTGYTTTFTKSVAAGAATAANITEANMILVPQSFTAATKYASASDNALLNGAFVAMRLKIMNNNTSSDVIADAGYTTSTDAWAIWPLPAPDVTTGENHGWLPGKKYTYTIDLAGGGYYEKNKASTDDNLDPILEGAEIKFVDVTVDDWADGPNTTIGNMTFAKGGTYTENIANAAGTYYITVTGLTSTSNVATSVGSLSSATVGTSGSVTITVPVSADAGTVTVTLTESGTASSTTTINLVPAP